MRRLVAISGFICLAVVLCWSGCAESRSDQAELRLGINPWPGYEFLFLAQELGYFEEEDVRLRLVEYSSLGDVRRAFERGQLDGMAATAIELLDVWQVSDRRPQIVLVPDFSDGSDVIMAKSPIHNVADLRGKRIGAEVASLGIFLLARALDQAGMTLDDVQVIPMDQGAMQEALTDGTVDAVVSYPPISVALGEVPDLQVVFSSKDIPGEIIDIVAFDEAVIGDHPQTMEGIIRAWDRAVAFSLESPAEAHAIMAARERISPEEFGDALSGIRVLSSHEQRDLLAPGGAAERSLVNAVETLKSIGQVEGDLPTHQMIARLPTAHASQSK